MQQLPGDERAKLGALSRIATRVPCFAMPLARDSAANLAALANLVEGTVPA